MAKWRFWLLSQCRDFREFGSTEEGIGIGGLGPRCFKADEAANSGPGKASSGCSMYYNFPINMVFSSQLRFALEPATDVIER
jgi:hypothetical protein